MSILPKKSLYQAQQEAIANSDIVFNIIHCLVNSKSIKSGDLQKICYAEHYEHLFYVFTVMLRHTMSDRLLGLLLLINDKYPETHERLMGDKRLIEKGLLSTKSTVIKHFMKSGFNILYRVRSVSGVDYYPFLKFISDPNSSVKKSSLACWIKPLVDLPTDITSARMLFMAAQRHLIVGRHLIKVSYPDPTHYEGIKVEGFYTVAFDAWSTHNTVTLMMESKIPLSDIAKNKLLLDYTVNEMFPYFTYKGLVSAWSPRIVELLSVIKKRFLDEKYALCTLSDSIAMIADHVGDDARMKILSGLVEDNNIRPSCAAFICIALAKSEHDVPSNSLLEHAMLPIIYMAKFNKSPYEMMQVLGVSDDSVGILMNMQLNT